MRKVSTLVALVMVAGLFSDCAVRRARVTYSYHGDVVMEAPPEPLVEVVVAPPGDDYVWTDGYWYWSGSRYVWYAGRWSRPPATGHVWVRSGWVVSDGRYRFVRGYWAPTSYRHRPTYVYTKPTVQRGPAYRTIQRRR